MYSDEPGGGFQNWRGHGHHAEARPVLRRPVVVGREGGGEKRDTTTPSTGPLPVA
jgi:hypothetical protein